MRKIQFMKTGATGICVVFLFLLLACFGRTGVMKARAEETGYSDSTQGAEETFWQDEYSADSGSQEALWDDASADSGGSSDAGTADDAYETETEILPGVYTMEEGWTEDSSLSSDDATVYVQDAYADMDTSETSLITCSFLETNYSRQDYEQLRDMLTNNLLYSNVNAQITTSAVYTLAMDYLYIILVDDSSADYQDIYHYVVGDYQCFCVEVKEYRDEAEQARALDLDTPREIGQKVAEGFVWN